MTDRDVELDFDLTPFLLKLVGIFNKIFLKLFFFLDSKIF